MPSRCEQSAGVVSIEWTISDVSIKINPRLKPHGIFRDKPPNRWVVIPLVRQADGAPLLFQPAKKFRVQTIQASFKPAIKFKYNVKPARHVRV